MKTTIRYVLIGLLAFVIFAIVWAPATLVRTVLADVPDVTLSEINGTLWDGSARLSYRSYPIGRIEWTFTPGSLLGLAAGFDWSLRADAHELSGHAALNFTEAEVESRGVIRPASINQVLAPYDIDIEGDFTIQSLNLVIAYDRTLPDAKGELNWTGGYVNYRLAGNYNHGSLPPIAAYVSTESGEPTMVAYAADNNDNDRIPLLHVKLDNAGWINIGITKRFTKLIGQPWPGSEPDHAVVLEVGEKLL
ncbi:MAG: type II secretion system protein N [Gammaproteobacteria bacterium]|nr:type II secretion system protein N [Gammaproteobacteria bacterium]